MFVSKHQPFLAASPDKLIFCQWHGFGCIEVKCLSKLRYNNMEESIETDPKFPLKRNSTSGEIGLNPDHEYDFQVQLQLMVTERKYGIFVMYTKRNLFYVRVELDSVFIQNVIRKCKVNNSSGNACLTVHRPGSGSQGNGSRFMCYWSSWDTTRYFPCVCQKILAIETDMVTCSAGGCVKKKIPQKMHRIKAIWCKLGLSNL
jgi:hypothetical protein